MLPKQFNNLYSHNFKNYLTTNFRFICQSHENTKSANTPFAPSFFISDKIFAVFVYSIVCKVHAGVILKKRIDKCFVTRKNVNNSIKSPYNVKYN